MSEKSSSSSSGIGFFGLLGVAFIVLKLCGVINWSWIWVLAPLWGGFAFILLVLLIAFLIVVFTDAKLKVKKR
jgi:hypothetical protein